MQVGFRPGYRPVQFGAVPPQDSPKATFEQAKELKSKIPSMLLGYSEIGPMELYESRFRVNGIGITKVGGAFAVALNTLTESGAREVVASLSNQPGFTRDVEGTPIGSLDEGDALVAIRSDGVTVPIVVRAIGEIVAG